MLFSFFLITFVVSLKQESDDADHTTFHLPGHHHVQYEHEDHIEHGPRTRVTLTPKGGASPAGAGVHSDFAAAQQTSEAQHSDATGHPGESGESGDGLSPEEQSMKVKQKDLADALQLQLIERALLICTTRQLYALALQHQALEVLALKSGVAAAATSLEAETSSTKDMAIAAQNVITSSMH
jgi:hypothetical protein